MTLILLMMMIMTWKNDFLKDFIKELGKSLKDDF